MNYGKIALLLSLSLSLALASNVYAQQVTQKKDGVTPESKTVKVQEKFGTISSSTFRVRERLQVNASSSTSTRDRIKATSTNKGSLAEEHRSEVSKFVKTLLDNADRTGGIGQQVRMIAREQASTSSTTTEAIEKIEKRSGFKTFLIGTDYKNIGALRSEMVQTRNRIEKLRGEISKVSTSTDKTTLEEELKNMEQLQDKIQGFITENENKFSLFGWLVRMFE